MVTLHNLPSQVGKRQKRRGRGYGSNAGGHTVGFGQKGQKSRGRGKKNPLFNGENTPMYRKMPKYRGFKSLNTKTIVVKSGMINATYKAGEEVSVQTLREKGLISTTKKPVKILFNEALSVAVTFNGVTMSKKVAETVIEKKVAAKKPVKTKAVPKAK